MLVTDAYVKRQWMLVIQMADTVTNILLLSHISFPTSVTNIDVTEHHRLVPLNWRSFRQRYCSNNIGLNCYTECQKNIRLHFRLLWQDHINAYCMVLSCKGLTIFNTWR